MRAALLAALGSCALAAQAEPAELLIEAELVPARVYVGAEATLLLRALRAPGVMHGAPRPPALGDAADVSPLGAIRRYETLRAGVAYQVLERSYAIVPRQAGRLVVPGIEIENLLRSTAARGPQRVLEVRAPPAGAPVPWLPARHLTLEESWSRDPEALAAGAPVTRTLVLAAQGLAAERLPQLEMPAHPALRVHYDRPELVTTYAGGGLAGHRVQRIVLMPLDEGEVELPALSVPWWDVAADAPRSAVLPGRTLRLGLASASDAALEVPPYIPDRTVPHGYLAAVVLLALAALWWYVRAQALREVRVQLRTACRRNDARGARDALLEWWKAVTPGAPAPLAQRIGEGWDAAARAQLRALDAALYGGSAWDGKAFWRSVRPWLRARAPRRAAGKGPPLPPLFRLQGRARVERRML